MDRLELPPLPASQALEYESDVAYAQRLYRRRRLASRALSAVFVATTLFSSSYTLPVAAEKLRLANTDPTLVHIADTPDHLAATSLVIAGFGVKSSEATALALPELAEIGSVEALNHDNEGIDSHVIAEMYMEQSRSSGLLEAGLWGDSNGGHIAIKVAREIQESDSQLRVRYIVLDCTPTSVETLREDKRATVDLIDTLSIALPDIATHPLVGYLYAQDRLDKRDNGNGHFGVSEILHEMYSPDRPSSRLLAAQAMLVVNPSMQDDFMAISQVETKAPPLVVVIRPEGDTDKTVISDLADEELFSMLAEAGMPYIHVSLEDIVHGDPTANAEQYQDALKNIILPALKEYDISIKSRLYASDSVR